MTRARAAIVAVALILGCATMRVPSAGLRVECDVPDATLWVDDVLMGRVAAWSKPGRALRAGFRRVEIRHPDFHSHYAELQLVDGVGAVIKAELRPVLE